MLRDALLWSILFQDTRRTNACYRATLQGYTESSVLNAICQEHLITEGEIELGCDNVKALQRAINSEYYMLLIHTHLELTTAIRYHDIYWDTKTTTPSNP